MKVLLHVCCGVCAAGAAERLLSEGHEVKGFFYNPNIHPQDEYERRLEAAFKVAEEMGFRLVAGMYMPESWFAITQSLEDEPEGGRRCEVCFKHRLDITCQYLKDSDYDVFTTTLTISPHKAAAMINRIGRAIGGDRFLERDFKKKAGFQRGTQLAKEMAIHRQDYCGCVYSVRSK
jgi:predicted adenine nucleotide alpha hydrolase (AANH) superfamily ATPase